jgi:hypothetical protein
MKFEKDFIDICIPSCVPTDTERHVYKTLFGLSNTYYKFMQKIKSPGIGNCMLVTKRLHRRIGGFNEDISFEEDYDYINRAAKTGGFKVYLDVNYYASVRRFEMETLKYSIKKSIKSDLLFLITGKTNEKVKHEFGKFGNRLMIDN